MPWTQDGDRIMSAEIIPFTGEIKERTTINKKELIRALLGIMLEFGTIEEIEAELHRRRSAKKL
jgi:hypothetical protein